MPDLLDESVVKYADHICTNFRGKKLKYREIGRLVDQAAKGFQQIGVAKGSVVAMMLPNCPYSVICFFAALKAGACVVHLNPLYSRHEIMEQLKNSNASVLVTLDMKPLYRKIAPDQPGDELPDNVRKILVCRISGLLKLTDKILFDLMKSKEVSQIPEDDRHVSFNSLVQNDGQAEMPVIDPYTDVAVRQYTGGTTGFPKAAKLTHANLYSNLDQLSICAKDARPGEEKVLAALPLFHAFGMTAVMNLGISVGAELILLPNFQISKLLDLFDKEKPTIFIGVPTMFFGLQ